MAGAQGQLERQIAGRRSDRQCNYAEPPAKTPEKACLASTVLRLPTPSCRPGLSQTHQPPAPAPRQGGGEPGASGEQLIFLGPGSEDGSFGEKASCSPGWLRKTSKALSLLGKASHHSHQRKL